MKVNMSIISWIVLIASTAELLFFSTVAFKVGCSVLSKNGLTSFDLGNLRLLAIFEEKLFKDFAIH